MDNIISKKPLSLAELKERLSKIEYDEPLYEFASSLEYAKKFSKLSLEKTLALKKDLLELGLTEDIAISIVNIVPKRTERLQALLPKEKNTDKELITKITDTIKKYKK